MRVRADSELRGTVSDTSSIEREHAREVAWIADLVDLCRSDNTPRPPPSASVAHGIGSSLSTRPWKNGPAGASRARLRDRWKVTGRHRRNHGARWAEALGTLEDAPSARLTNKAVPRSESVHADQDTTTKTPPQRQLLSCSRTRTRRYHAGQVASDEGL